MKKIFLASAILLTVVACKKDNKTDVVVGKNEAGQELVVSESGDTIIKTEIQNDTVAKPLEVHSVSAIQKGEDDKYDFRYNLEKGKTYPLTLTIKGTHSASDGKQDVKMSNESKKSIEYTVKDIKDGVYTLEVKSKHYSEKMTDPTGKSISYDTNSSKPADKDVAVSWNIYKAMVGKPYTMKIDQKGKVIAVDGLDNIRKQIENSVKNQLSAEEQKFISEILKNSLNKEAISAQFEETMNIYPNKKLKLNESWSDKQNINQGPMKGSTDLTRTLANVDTKNTKITVKGTQKLSGSESQEGMKMSANANADVNGTILIDTQSGWINNVSLTKKETMKRTMEMNGQKQTMTESVTTSTSVN
ncbi:DUF6263 family protein [Faecalibacter rhinopitheci]|uniref:Lipoprotein n=1 Tax=Faecalibacter rhinopitheci TaxID=2779678 RepID=A0A8J7FMZ6_9FLAO|nr:DUF6263 family protein [Faecalibacter rhinopitheci]MBF0597397.1 hypothetical protein [Faecalibacter rhinopitheci]MBQ0147179.1 hypothetical protein [Candidatus Onthonaster equi]